MLFNYLTIAIRNFINEWKYSLINMIGLSSGIAACIMILQYVHFERSYDDFHEDLEDIYYLPMKFTGEQNLYLNAHPSVAPLFKRSLGEITEACRINSLQPFSELEPSEGFLKNKELGKSSVILQKGIYAVDPSFFTLFSYELLSGDKKNVLEQPNAMVMTQTIAHKFFPDQDPLNKELELMHDGVPIMFKVTGIAKDPPKNSFLPFTILLSRTPGIPGYQLDNTWDYPAFFTFIKVRPGTNPEVLQKKFRPLIKDHVADIEERISTRQDVEVLRIIDMHFWTEKNLWNPGVGTENTLSMSGDEKVVNFFLVLSVFILLISWINYINLTTARSIRRSREIGIRKVSGATRRGLTLQFILEATVMNALCVFLGLIVCQLLFPLFAGLIESQASFTFMSNGFFWLFLVCFIVMGGIVTGFYPALVISGLSPVVSLKGDKKEKVTGNPFRRVLVSIQFFFSIMAIAFVYMLYQQVAFMKNYHLGMTIDQVLTINIDGLSKVQKAGLLEKLRGKLDGLPTIHSIASSWDVPGDNKSANQTFKRNWSEETELFYDIRSVSRGFIETLDIKLLLGRDFNEDLKTEATSCIISLSAVDELGFEGPEDALSQTIIYTKDSTELTIIGIVDEYHYNSARSKNWPSVFVLAERDPDFIKGTANNSSTILLRLNANGMPMKEMVGAIETVWNELYPDDAFVYSFLDSQFDRLYKTDRQFNSVFWFMAMMGILIACLGLFGLSSYNTLQRSKEIGIRKILGGSVNSILWLFSREYMRIVLITSVVGLSVSWWLFEKWLQNYPNQVHFSADMIVVPFMIILLLAVFTVGFQTYKTATSNPVRSLRYE